MAPPSPERRAKGGMPAFAPTLEHVWPRAMGAREWAQTVKSKFRRHGTRGNAVAAHARCNAKKGDRKPTGCEILTLELVNARLAGSKVVRPVLNLTAALRHMQEVVDGKLKPLDERRD